MPVPPPPVHPVTSGSMTASTGISGVAGVVATLPQSGIVASETWRQLVSRVVWLSSQPSPVQISAGTWSGSVAPSRVVYSSKSVSVPGRPGCTRSGPD